MTEGLPSPNDREIGKLLRISKRRRIARVIVQLAWGIVISLFAALFMAHLSHNPSDNKDQDQLRIAHELVDLQQPWSDDLAQQWEGYREWLSLHGIKLESELFDSLSSIVVQSAISSNAASTPSDELGLLGKTYLAFHTGTVRVLFLIFASARLCLAATLVAFFFGITGISPYTKDDALGQMGNGRVFYSGVKAGLDKLASNGAPDVQIRGFACPQLSSVTEAHASTIWKVLTRYGATTSTNEALTRILTKNADTASYVALQEDEELLARSFCGEKLGGNTAYLLDVALRTHARYGEGNVGDTTSDLPSNTSPDQQLNSREYADAVSTSLHRVLSPAMRSELASLDAAEVATTILALESGKVLAHSFEGGRWVRRSNLPHLSARAVLHSVVEYPRDYTFEQRARIRRALIYAARKSAFAPVRMPTDMSDDCWVMRQWMEVLLACPYELQAVTDEVELVGIVRESHQAWCREFFDSDALITPEVVAESYSTPTDLLFLPVPRVVALLRRVVMPETIARMRQLLEKVRLKQQEQRLRVQDSESGPIEQLSFDRLHAAPPQDELTTIATTHGMTPHDLSDWLALKIVLSSYGWLASRVGDYSVPETSTIFAVFRPEHSLQGANSLGLLGRPGMVPVRGSKLTPRWGRQWTSRFVYVRKVTMAETQDDYEKLLQGIEDIDEPPEDSMLKPSSIVS